MKTNIFYHFTECNIHKKSCILGCKTKTGEQVHYHDFPVNKVIRKKWIAACKLRNTQVKDNMFICSAHFKKNDYLTGKLARKISFKFLVY